VKKKKTFLKNKSESFAHFMDADGQILILSYNGKQWEWETILFFGRHPLEWRTEY